MPKQYLKQLLTAVNLESTARYVWKYARYAYILGARVVKSFSKRPRSAILKTFSRQHREVFFGYYDVTPFSSDENFLLAMHAPVRNVTPKPETDITVGYYNLIEDNSPFIEIGKTSTWCWQQGCRLQWYPQNGNKTVLYNKIVEGQYGCVIQDINSEVIRSFKRPLYSVSHDGRWGLSLNFSRLQRLRPGYGYVNIPDDTLGQPVPEHDGIWRINMKTGEEDFLFSIAEISQIDPLDSMTSAEHYFNHILFNPDGTRFMFFHLWMKDGKRFNRLITCNIDGKERYPLINEGHVSHYAWKSNTELLAYATHEATGRHYHLYKDRTNERSVVGKGILDQDGHPSYSPDGSMILTDTYPDKFRDQHLLIYDMEKNKLSTVGTFYSPFKFTGETRCRLRRHRRLCHTRCWPRPQPARSAR